VDSFSCYYIPDPCTSRYLGEKPTGFSSLNKITPADTLKANAFQKRIQWKIEDTSNPRLLHNPINVSNFNVIIIIKDENKEERKKNKERSTKNQKERKDIKE
jgi:hypothetical protein